MTRLMSLGCFRFVTFAQYLHGQYRKKPTSLLILRMPGLEKTVLRPCLPVQLIKKYHDDLCTKEGLKEGVTTGYDEKEKRWMTSPHKTYPPSLCKCLAQSILSVVSNAYQGTRSDLSCDLTQIESEAVATLVEQAQLIIPQRQGDYFRRSDVDG